MKRNMKRIEVVARILSQRKILQDVCQDEELLGSELERLASVADMVTNPEGKVRENVDSLLAMFRDNYIPVGSRIRFRAYTVNREEAYFTLVSTFAGPMMENSDYIIQDNPDLAKAIIDFLESEAENFDPDWLKIKTKEPEFRVLTREFPDAVVTMMIPQTGEMAPFVKGLTVDLHFCDDEEVPRCAEVFNKDHDEYHAEIGLTFDGKTLVGYDGVLELHKELVTSLTELGYTIDIGK